jgi:hypothetical protein
MMNWVTIAFAALTVIALVGVAADEVRARNSQPHRPSPLAGMTKTDVLIGLGFILPTLIAGFAAIQYVLT